MNSTGIGFLLIVAFVIDRSVSAALFLLNFAGVFPDPLARPEGPQRAKAEKIQKLIYFGLSVLLAAVAIAKEWVPVLQISKPESFQQLLTLLVLVGGAERLGAISNLLNGAQAKDAEAPQPIQITGKLTLEEGVLRIRRAAGRDGD